MTAPRLKALGFDRSAREAGHLRVRCSQCQALVINGYPTHEHGCPNRAPAESKP